MSEAQAAEGPLTIDAAIGLLGAEPPPEENDAPAEQTDEIEAEPPAEDAPDAEEPIEDAPEEPEEPEEAIPPPQSWSAEDRAVWDQIPAEAKATIMARETDRDRATQKAVQEASEARRKADTELQGVTTLKAAIEQVLPRAEAVFQSKWKDWTPQAQVELARTNPDLYIARKAEFEAEQAEMARLQVVNQATRELEFQHFVQAENEKLKSLAPDLADPREGQAKRQAVAAFIQAQGVDPSVIPTLDAVTVAVAYDAMRYRELMARGVRPDKNPAPKPPVRPTAAAPVRTPQRAAEAAKNRFVQTNSIEDAVNVLNSRSGS